MNWVLNGNSLKDFGIFKVNEKMATMNVNEILSFLKNLGVKEVVCAPGGRCRDLLNAFVRDSSFNVTTVYDERTAGFYALGLSFNSPTVVLTTSGTAVTELTSSVAEAFYQKDSKLIALTADRPLILRHTGAPQSLNQHEVFKNFTRSFVDLFKDTSPLKSVERSFPMHINVCLDEPNPSKQTNSLKNYGPLLVVSELNVLEQKQVKNSLKDYDGALALELLSNLKESDFPKAKIIKYAEPFLISSNLNSFTFVVRLGGVPVFKPWRDIKNIKTYYWSEASEFPGGVDVEAFKLDELKNLLLDKEKPQNLSNEIIDFVNKVNGIIKRHPSSEVGMLNRLSKHIENDDEVFLGNSLPIREWEYVQNKNYKIYGQRGVNGIDGSLAFALGRLNPSKTNWIILGDLTSLYNFNDFQLIEKFLKRNIRIVVVNNYGGQIFRQVIKERTDSFLNSHQKSFKDISNFWELNYFNNEFKFSDQKILLEINPDNASSNSFWKSLNSL